MLKSAIEESDHKMVKILCSNYITARAIREIKDYRKKTPLYLAVEKNDLTSVRILLKAGWNVNTGLQLMRQVSRE